MQWHCPEQIEEMAPVFWPGRYEFGQHDEDEVSDDDDMRHLWLITDSECIDEYLKAVEGLRSDETWAPTSAWRLYRDPEDLPRARRLLDYIRAEKAALTGNRRPTTRK